MSTNPPPLTTSDSRAKTTRWGGTKESSAPRPASPSPPVITSSAAPMPSTVAEKGPNVKPPTAEAADPAARRRAAGGKPGSPRAGAGCDRERMGVGRADILVDHERDFETDTAAETQPG